MPYGAHSQVKPVLTHRPPARTLAMCGQRKPSAPRLLFCCTVPDGPACATPRHTRPCARVFTCTSVCLRGAAAACFGHHPSPWPPARPSATYRCRELYGGTACGAQWLPARSLPGAGIDQVAASPCQGWPFRARLPRLITHIGIQNSHRRCPGRGRGFISAAATQRATQPATQTCTVAAGTGTVQSAAVTTVAVT